LLCAIVLVGIITIGVFFTNILNVDKFAEEKMKKVSTSKKIVKNGEIVEQSTYEIDIELKDEKK